MVNHDTQKEKMVVKILLECKSNALVKNNDYMKMNLKAKGK